MKLVLLGGFGYIGSKVLEEISSNHNYKNWEIVVIDNWNYGRGMTAVYEYFKKSIKNFNFYCFDISDSNIEKQDKFKKIINDTDFIINLCSLTQVPSTNLHEKYIIEGVNRLSSNIRESCNKIKKIIDISSTSIYGSVSIENNNYREPYSEEIFPDPEKSLHNYASSKLHAEKIWKREINTDLPYTILRLSTVFGYAIGLRYNQFINELLINFITDRPTLVPGSPLNIRPFIHINDVISIFYKMLDLNEIGNNEIINIGSESLNLPLDDIYKNIKSYLIKEFNLVQDYKFAIEENPNALQENYLVDFSKFKKIYNFKLKYDFINGSEEYLKKIINE